jgi:GGDEF domain-containing protein
MLRLTAQVLMTIDDSEPIPILQRFSSGVSRLGAVRATLLLSLVGSLGSFGLPWIFLWISGSHRMGNAIWISLLVPIPLTIAFGGICMFLVISLDKVWKRAHELAMVDALTGLSNRRDFMPAAQRQLDLALRHHQPLALMVLDVDHFKSINDTLGHLGGDEVLVKVAHRFRNALRTTDLLARWGGEEFITLLPNTPLAQARQLA